MFSWSLQVFQAVPSYYVGNADHLVQTQILASRNGKHYMSCSSQTSLSLATDLNR